MTSEGGGWTLAGHQHPTEYFTRTTENINVDNFNPQTTFRYGNDIVQQMIPSVAWRITSNDINSEILTDNAWFRPECVIDWDVYAGIQDDITVFGLGLWNCLHRRKLHRFCWWCIYRSQLFTRYWTK